MSARSKISAWLLILASAAWAGPVLRFALHDSAGAVHKQDEWTPARAVVIFFVTTDCPLSNGYAPEMNRIEQAYASRGVRVYAVQGDTTIADEEVRRHAREFAYRFPVLLDPQLILSRFTGATSLHSGGGGPFGRRCLAVPGAHRQPSGRFR